MRNIVIKGKHPDHILESCLINRTRSSSFLGISLDKTQRETIAPETAKIVPATSKRNHSIVSDIGQVY